MDQVKQNVHNILWIFLWVCCSYASRVKYNQMYHTIPTFSMYLLYPSLWSAATYPCDCVLHRITTNPSTHCTLTRKNQEIFEISQRNHCRKAILQLYNLSWPCCPRQSLEPSHKHIKFPKVDMLWLQHSCDLRIAYPLTHKQKECSLSLYVLYVSPNISSWSYIGIRSFHLSFDKFS